MIHARLVHSRSNTWKLLYCESTSGRKQIIVTMDCVEQCCPREVLRRIGVTPLVESMSLSSDVANVIRNASAPVSVSVRSECAKSRCFREESTVLMQFIFYKRKSKSRNLSFGLRHSTHVFLHAVDVLGFRFFAMRDAPVVGVSCNIAMTRAIDSVQHI